MNQSKRPTNKLLSGRLWLTIICGLSFLMFVLTLCQIMYVKRDAISPSELTSVVNVVLLIISNVMTFYFTKNREDMITEKKETAQFIKDNSSQQEEVK